MKKKKTFSAGMNVGSSSILVTFVLLCLVTFAALSFVSAKSDNSLTVQTANRISDFYKADSLAEINLANIDSLLTKLAESTDEKSYFENIEKQFSDNDMYEIINNEDGTFIKYSISVSDSQDLNVTLKAVYPEDSTSDTFIITEWENVTTYIPPVETMEEEKGGFLF